MRLADAISLRSRERKLRLFLDELQPTPDTSVLDVGADELGFGEGDGCGTLNFFEERYPWPERITALGLHDGDGLSRALPGHSLRPGRRVRPPLRGRRIRRRVLERGDRARRRPRAPAQARQRGDPGGSPRLHHDAQPPLSRRGAHAAAARPLASRTRSRTGCIEQPGRSSRPTSSCLSRRSFAALFPGRVRVVSLGLTLVAIVD